VSAHVLNKINAAAPLYAPLADQICKPVFRTNKPFELARRTSGCSHFTIDLKPYNIPTPGILQWRRV
jgi:hypothetical protein